PCDPVSTRSTGIRPTREPPQRWVPPIPAGCQEPLPRPGSKPCGRELACSRARDRVADVRVASAREDGLHCAPPHSSAHGQSDRQTLANLTWSSRRRFGQPPSTTRPLRKGCSRTGGVV